MTPTMDHLPYSKYCSFQSTSYVLLLHLNALTHWPKTGSYAYILHHQQIPSVNFLTCSSCKGSWVAGAYPNIKVGGLKVCHRVNTDRQTTTHSYIYTSKLFHTRNITSPWYFCRFANNFKWNMDKNKFCNKNCYNLKVKWVKQKIKCIIGKKSVFIYEWVCVCVCFWLWD